MIEINHYISRSYLYAHKIGGTGSPFPSIRISFDKTQCFGQYGAAVPQFKERVMEFPTDRLYSEDHLWVKLEKEQALIGISDYAREELGEVDYIELPQVDEALSKNRPFGIIETSKAVTDLLAPISGVVLECNNLLTESPETLTDDPYGDGWLIIVEPSDPDEIDELLNHKAYGKLVKSQEKE